tara:strand:+ start:358 stop:579 length:222 start_codon:yes stop_codon:yes gene_type:complete
MDNTANACEIIRENYPVFFKENMWAIISACVDNEEWSERIVINSRRDMMPRLQDIAHDIRGLSVDDELFLPRI